ncbi:XdhC family protein [Comamonas composti]|uniref:XdhC family protein n=1 Tax=Comamonas composti TaxID=408558 RepID=UPI00316ADFE5
MRVLSSLSYRLLWIDSRESVFEEGQRSDLLVRCEYSDPVQSAVADLPAGSQVLIMSFSHAEELEILIQCLKRQRLHADLPFIGLIGSASKWKVFQRRLVQRGFAEQELARVTCPVGLPGIAGKGPEVIAVAAAVQLLQRRTF